jgi:two-component system sensor histidine kinase/response regulator
MSKAHVLIVDDDAALLEALAEMLRLRMDNVRVTTTDSAIDAVARIADYDYDAIVADIKMPGMDGLQLLARIQDLQPDTPTLLITGHGEHDLAVQALRGGAHDYVQKPIDRDYFLGSLRHALDVRRLSRQVGHQKELLEHEAEELKRCLQERSKELRILHQREVMARVEVDRINQDLREAQRRRDEVVAMVVHDLGAPLTTLKGYVDILSRPGSPEQVQARARSIIVSETRRMERLVADLAGGTVESARAFQVELTSGDLAGIVREQVELARVRSDRHSIDLDAPERLPIPCDGDRLAQVLANLIDNAITHTVGGTIHVRVWRDGRAARVSVKDEGDGIPSSQLEAIFQPRVRLMRTRSAVDPPGAGLGLAIARAIVEAHRGRLWAEHATTGGAEFQVSLPLAAASRSERAAVARPKRPARRASRP